MNKNKFILPITFLLLCVITAIQCRHFTPPLPLVAEKPALKEEAKEDWIEQQVNRISPNAPELDRSILRLALTDYKKAVDSGVTQSPILTVVDYSLSSGKPRLWVLDLFHNRVLFHELVAHGKNSGTHAVATSFSNKHSSQQSSLGLFLTGQKYIGAKHGTSLKLHGLNKGINDNAYPRGVIMHGAHYVTEEMAKLKGHVGRSFGCLSVRHKVARELIDTIKDGTLVYAYHPQLLALA